MSPAEEAQAAYDEADDGFKAEIAIAMRDGFACSALTGLLSHRHNGYMSPGETAERAYEYADAMMVARGPQ